MASKFMSKFMHGGNQVQQITNEIIQGLQNGSMQVENIDVRWSGHTQHYVVTVADLARTAALSQWASALSSPVAPAFPEKKKEPVIQNLGTITEPITGFRDFFLGNGPYPDPGLISRNKAPWPMREPMRAFCKGSALAPHDAPEINCECGIYAFSGPEEPGLQTGNATLWGEIAMWGEVLIAEKGYRSEFAYPKTLFLQDTGTKAVRWLRDYLADGYGVPVLLVEKREGKTASQIMGEMLAEMTKEQTS